MLKQEKLITFIYYLVTIMIAFNYVGLASLAILTLVTFWVSGLREVIHLEVGNLSQGWLLLAGLAILINAILWILVLKAIKQFLKNLLADQIFTNQNVSLARKTSLYLFLLAIFSNSSGMLQFGVDGNHLSLFDLTYILAALLVWVLSVVLERAVAIAEENEFTI